MTLKEKFDNLDSSSKDRMGIFYHDSDKCVEIADDYAIEFSEWVLLRHYLKLVKKDTTSKELLEIFKYEKGL
jgi:hypothetical protein